jgi:hypothetical protein
MKKARIKSMGDFEKLPEGEWVGVEGGDLEVKLKISIVPEVRRGK